MVLMEELLNFDKKLKKDGLWYENKKKQLNGSQLTI